MTKKAKGITYGVIGIVVLSAVFSPDKKVESIELSVPDYQIEYDINTKIPIEITLSPTNADDKSIEYITSDDSITFSDSGILTGDVEGTFDVYVVIDDVTSNTISINVVDISAREYAMVETEAQQDDTEQVTSQEDHEEQPSGDELTNQELTAPQDVDIPAENDNTDQQPSEAQSDRNDNNTSEITSPPSIEEQPSEHSTEPQSPDVPPVQATEPTESVEVPTPEVPVVQQNPDANPPAEELGNTAVPASSGNNNFDTYDNASQQQTDFTYVLNTNTMKIHHPSCSSVKKIAPHNYATSNSTLEELFAQGYTTCGICFR